MVGRATMVYVNRLAANSSPSAPRRFILLPEETALGEPKGPRTRRYKLASVGLGAGRLRTGSSSAEPGAFIAHGFGRLDGG